MSEFVHLHAHSEYSLLDGALRINAAAGTAAALTDHGVLYGALKWYKACRARGVKPIIGCEVYVAQGNRYATGTKKYHLLLLAENQTGYKNLMKLVTASFSAGKRPRVDKELLREYHAGIIALSGCVRGEVAQAILNDDFARAKNSALEYAKIFGRENFFLEVQNHGLEDELKVRRALKILSAELKIDLAATNDVHYASKSDSEIQDVLLCIGTGKKLNDAGRLKFPCDEYYLKSAEEMRELFEDMPSAYTNTEKIAARCNVTIEFGKKQMPTYPLPKGTSEEKFLRALCEKKIRERYSAVTDEIKSRLEHELKIIHSMGYDGYFLIVWDFIEYARREKIAVGPGRGSAAGSLVAFVLGITQLDPIKHNLLFERFLNPERVTLPDIDVDLCCKRRDEVTDYVKAKYGADKVAQIVTFGRLTTKAAIRDVARVLDVPFAESSRLIKMIPDELNITLDDALKKSAELRDDYEKNSLSRKIIDLARKIEGIPRHASVHAAGVVISKEPLEEIVPLQILNDVLVTQYDKDDLEDLGLLKMDFLGLRTLTIISETLKNIKATCGENLKLEEIPLRDSKTAAMLSNGDTAAVFQMESEGMTALVKKLEPKSFEDLIPLLALYRPGPLGSGMVEDFVAGKHGLKPPRYPHPKLEPILKETYGVILYQEQVMQIVQTLALFSLGQADILRRAMSKKKAEILLAQKENFLRGCESNGVKKSVAEEIFELLSRFADYGFNKSHSAAYGLLAWQTAYLKAHYPAQFMAATMSEIIDANKISGYIKSSRQKGIKILPPDVNFSEENFTVEDGAIRFGLSTIKSISEATVVNILNERDGGKFTSFENFCSRLDTKKVPRSSVEKLIKCGAFDGVDNRRTALLAAMDKILETSGGAINLFNFEAANQIPDVEEVSQREILAWEKDALGFYISGHPLNPYREKFSDLFGSKDLSSRAGRLTNVFGVVTQVRRRMTKKGDEMAFIELEDFDGALDVVIFPKIFYESFKVVQVDEVVVAKGRVEISNDTVQLLAEKIWAAQDYAPDFWLMIPETLETPETFDALKKFFTEHAGRNRIFLNRGGKWQKMPFKISDAPEVRDALKNFLGSQNVKFY